MLVHQVYFWLKPELSKEQIAKFEAGLKSLLTINTIKNGNVGIPANTENRHVIDRSYSYALLTVFDDVEGHDAYQIDPIHKKFIEECKEFWLKVQIYDAVSI